VNLWKVSISSSAKVRCFISVFEMVLTCETTDECSFFHRQLVSRPFEAAHPSERSVSLRIVRWRPSVLLRSLGVLPSETSPFPTELRASEQRHSAVRVSSASISPSS
jgi:hypothetical protein